VANLCLRLRHGRSQSRCDGRSVGKGDGGAGRLSWQENTYPSLSTIAQAITATSWNGPSPEGKPSPHPSHRAKAADLDRAAETPPATVKELYRSVAPIPDLKPGRYDINLSRITFPAAMPSNAPHHRSGAALYYIVSGTGANTVDGKMSLSFSLRYWLRY
jgi:hypothetical protein